MPEPTNPVSARRVILISFLVDLSDVILNVAVTILSGSVIMLSQALEGAADLVASGLLLVGFQRSNKPADKIHPFGYGREMYFWSLLAGLVMLAITATLSFYFGLERYLHPQPIHNFALSMTVLIIGFFTNLYAFIISLRRLLRTHHPQQIIRIFIRSSLVETKTTFILDMMGTIASLLGIIALIIYQITGDLRFDGLGAMTIGAVLAGLAYFLVAGIRDFLTGRSASPETESQIRQATLTIPEVKHVLGIKTLHIGPERLLVNLDVHLDRSLSTREIEKLIDIIKDKVRHEVPSVKHIQVELETPR